MELTGLLLRSEIYEALNINSDDSNVSDRLIDSLIANKRAVAVSNELSKNKRIPTALEQTLPCLSLEKASPSDCCNVTSDCKVVRTVNKIPMPIALKNSDAITHVGPLNPFIKEFTHVYYEVIPYIGNGRFNSSAIYSTYYDGRIFLFSKCNFDYKVFENILVRGVFENPADAGKLKNCENLPCFSIEDEYPITRKMWTRDVKPYVIQELLPKLQLQEDKSNDNADNRKITE